MFRVAPPQDVASSSIAAATEAPGRRRTGQNEPIDQIARQMQPSQTVQPQPIAVDPLLHNTFPYPVYVHQPRGIQPPQQTWQGSSGIAPQQTHLTPIPHMINRAQFREDGWDGYDHTAAQAAADGLGGTASNGYDYRYRDDQQSWVAGPHPYYDPTVSLVFFKRLCRA